MIEAQPKLESWGANCLVELGWFAVKKMGVVGSKFELHLETAGPSAQMTDLSFYKYSQYSKSPPEGLDCESETETCRRLSSDRRDSFFSKGLKFRHLQSLVSPQMACAQRRPIRAQNKLSPDHDYDELAKEAYGLVGLEPSYYLTRFLPFLSVFLLIGMLLTQIRPSLRTIQADVRLNSRLASCYKQRNHLRVLCIHP